MRKQWPISREGSDTMKFKPQLLSNDEYDLNSLDFTEMYISEKRDGVRAEVSNKGILNRSLKVLPNVKVQAWFKEVYENLPDGIIIEAEIHSESLPCRIIAGICNSDEKDVPEDLKLYIFGIYDEKLNFTERMVKLDKVLKPIKSKRYALIKQLMVCSAKEARILYRDFIKKGYEGAVLMSGAGRYKNGRVTINEHIGFKWKPVREDDLEILDITERMLNTNESLTNELGRSYKRNTVDAKESTGIAATFICKLENGMSCGVTITGDEESRRKIWLNKSFYIGKIAVVKSMEGGQKDKLRHPVLIRIKEGIEK